MGYLSRPACTTSDSKQIKKPSSSPSGSTKAHQKLLHDVLLKFGSRPDIRLWKNATGVAKIDSRIIRYGLIGSSDIIGIHAPTGRFIAIEIKTGNAKQSEQQQKFQAMIEKFGGLYILVRHVDDIKI